MGQTGDLTCTAATADDGPEIATLLAGADVGGGPRAAGGRGPVMPTLDAAVVALAPRLRSFIRQRVRDDATADDLAQETLLKVYRTKAKLREGERVDAWLYRIARRVVIDHYRRQRPREKLPEQLAAESTAPVAAVETVMAQALLHYLDELPPLYREPLRLAEIEGLPLAKIALRLDLSVTAVKSRVRRGRQQLKGKIQDCCRLEFDRAGRIIDYERRPGAVGCG